MYMHWLLVAAYEPFLAAFSGFGHRLEHQGSDNIPAMQ